MATVLHTRFGLEPYSHVSGEPPPLVGVHFAPGVGACAGQGVDPPPSVAESPPEPVSVPESLGGLNVEPPQATTREQARVRKVRMGGDQCKHAANRGDARKRDNVEGS